MFFKISIYKQRIDIDYLSISNEQYIISYHCSLLRVDIDLRSEVLPTVSHFII